MAIDNERVYKDANDLLADRAEYLKIDVMKKGSHWHVVLRLDGDYAVKSGIPGFSAEDSAEYFRKHVGTMLAATVGESKLDSWES